MLGRGECGGLDSFEGEASAESDSLGVGDPEDSCASGDPEEPEALGEVTGAEGSTASGVVDDDPPPSASEEHAPTNRAPHTASTAVFTGNEP
ncbi:hypothetical protein CYJ76_08885, partial [Kytococcus schroeteri]